MAVYINHIGTANPENKILQQKIGTFMARVQGMNEEERRKLSILYRASGIKSRYTVLKDYAREPGEFDFYANTPDMEPFPSVGSRMRIYEKEALDLSIRSIRNTVPKDFDYQKVTHLITVSCTGMYAPGLDIELVEKLGLPTHVKRTAICFMGCYAAFNALKTAYQICQADPQAQALVVCVELCTLHFQREKDEDNLLANALFGDGAASLLVSGEMTEGINLSLDNFYNDLAFQGKQEMAWHIQDSGFQMRLTSMVPTIIKEGISQLTHNLLSFLQMTLRDISYYAIHPGGKRILKVIEEVLGMSSDDNRYAYEVMREYGNMSSPTVLFVLKEMLRDLGPKDAGKSVLSFAFGPGLTLESMLLTIHHR
ncbi:MAG: type III polyketide synthase [Bacteroidota bacterium]